MTKIKSIDAALLLFKDSAMQHANATEKGNYKLANKAYKGIKDAVFYLKGEDALGLLSQLLASESIGIRLWAATYLLPTQTKICVDILTKIREAGGVHALTAKYTLIEWEKGSLNI
jgi:hypothetical protein